MDKDLRYLQEEIIRFRDARDWKQFHNPKDLALSIVLEASELMEHFQWKSQNEVDVYVKSHKEDIGAEMSDVLNYLLILANDLGIDLLGVSLRKLAKNNEKYSVKNAKGNHTKYTEFTK